MYRLKLDYQRVVGEIQNMRRIQHAIVDSEDREGHVPRNLGGLRAKKSPRLTVSKETGITVLQPQGIEFSPEQK